MGIHQEFSRKIQTYKCKTSPHPNGAEYGGLKVLVIVKGTADPHRLRVRVQWVQVQVQIALPATFLMT